MDNGHYKMPIPFKEEMSKLPINKICALHRLRGHEKRLKNNETYYKDYMNFVDDIISCGDTERVPEEEIDNSPVWYIPHHGVYHLQKQKDTCSVRLFCQVSRDISL